MYDVNKPELVSSTIPATMQAVVAPQPDGAEELALVERPVPRPGKGEVLIRVAAAGVNRPDILQRRGLYHKDYRGKTLRDNLGLPVPPVGEWKLGAKAAAAE